MLLFNLFILITYCLTIISGQTKTEEECVCVPYYQCEDGKVLVTGEGLLDPRLKTCSGIEVCCILPDDDGTDGGPKTPPTQKPPVVTPVPEKPDTGNDGHTPTDGVGPSLPIVSDGEGCGRRRYPGDVKLGDNAVRITGLLGYPEETFYGEAPWMVRLLKVENGKINDTYLMCGGALITPSVVLTAAHCVNKLKTDEIIARVGDWNVKARYEPIHPEDRKVVRTILHPDFNSRNLANDIALLGLDQPVKFSEVVDTVCTPDEEHVVNKTACIAVGWGKNDLSRYGTYQDTLRKVLLPIIEKDDCQAKMRKTKLGKFFKLLPGFLCAGGIQDSDTCEGDGGGPLYCPLKANPERYAVVGVISWGIDCGKGNPAVFADVAHYMPWIKKQIS